MCNCSNRLTRLSLELTILSSWTLSRLNGFEAWRLLGESGGLVWIIIVAIYVAIGLICYSGSWVGCFGGLWEWLFLLCLIRIISKALAIVVVSVVGLCSFEWTLSLLRRWRLRVTVFTVSTGSRRWRVSIAIIVVIVLLMRWQIVSTILLLLLWLLLVTIRSVFIIIIVVQHILLMMSSGFVQIVNGMRWSMDGTNCGPWCWWWCTKWQRVVN